MAGAPCDNAAFLVVGMLTSGCYSSNPVAVHRAVRGLERPMFAQWLALFEATAAELFAAAVAAQFAAKACRIAGSLAQAIFHRIDEPRDALAPRVMRHSAE